MEKREERKGRGERGEREEERGVWSAWMGQCSIGREQSVVKPKPKLKLKLPQERARFRGAELGGPVDTTGKAEGLGR